MGYSGPGVDAPGGALVPGAFDFLLRVAHANQRVTGYVCTDCPKVIQNPLKSRIMNSRMP